MRRRSRLRGRRRDGDEVVRGVYIGINKLLQTIVMPDEAPGDVSYDFPIFSRENDKNKQGRYGAYSKFR